MPATQKRSKDARRNGKSPANTAGNGKPPVNHTDWTQWKHHLVTRRQPIEIRAIFASGKRSPLLWATSADALGDGTLRLVDDLHEYCRNCKSRASRIVDTLETWLAESAVRPGDVGRAVECLAWCHALLKLADQLTAAPWWDLFECLASAAQEARGTAVEYDPLANQLLAGELGLTLAFQFPEVARTAELLTPARDALSAGVTQLLDGDGLPHARYLPIARTLLACWTRCEAMGRRLPDGCLSGDALTAYQWFVRQSLRLTRHSGTQMLAAPKTELGTKKLFAAALRLTDDPDDVAAARLAVSSGLFEDELRAGAPPESAAHSEWAEMALLRSNWKRTSASLALTFHDRKIESELNVGGETVWSGHTDPDIQINGQRLSLRADWEEVCWHSDDDVDYVEIEAHLDLGWRVQRQILLARDDNFLFMADAVLGQAEATVDYRCVFPLEEQVRFCAAADSHDGVLQGTRGLALALPLGLPEWRADRRVGNFQQVEDGLALTQRTTGTALYAPLFFDLHRTRQLKPFTWRRLTVAEKLEIQRPEVAQGFRVHVGQRQWLFYRSLARPGNRTVLGQNFSTEFFAGRLKKDGEAEELLEIL